jgi:2-polyprenyl-3-methyl-5-hydroxy-6-metoxy-1,4-benzoquinol methylase
VKAIARWLLGIPNPKTFATEQKLQFALNEISELRQLVRVLLSESPRFAASMAQTSESFDVQWDKLPAGVQLHGNPEFDRQSISLLEQYTGLPKPWFAGKSVLDAGCGNGRWSYVMAGLGAKVTAMDQSAAGLAEVGRICAAFPGFRTVRHDILQPLPPDQYDFVWHFGVAHHTGNTELALRNVSGAVRPGGMIFTMIYGEPRQDHRGDFAEVNAYIALRRETSAMSFDERIAFLRQRYPEQDVNAWFDAISPKINDLHRFDEVRDWLVAWGFEDVRRTFENRNLFITARRRG